MARLPRSARVLPPVRPNLGLEAHYRATLLGYLDEMNHSVCYWLEAAYKANEPRVLELMEEVAEDSVEMRALVAMDATPATTLQRVVARLARRWTRRFDELSQRLAEHFATAAADRSDRALANYLKRGGFTVQFKMTAAQRDIIQSTVNQSVGLIRSIPAQYLSDVQGLVMRSVQTGRDLGTLRDDLLARYDITKKRAALIARDQNNKATSAMTRARHLELGITEAIWIHSGGGKVPRPSHVAKNNKRYSVAEGWYDPDEGKNIWPGELINCRCVSRAVIPGLST